ncbi:hypothetical protein XH88_21655 [Bradyrhizobium sp. CCBAU 51627]|nr:hypothetical protein [Bradyrhizobium sp. CCBAU 51627]
MRQKSDERIRAAAISHKMLPPLLHHCNTFRALEMNRNVACVHRLNFASHGLKIIFEIILRDANRLRGGSIWTS